ncbi:MULTISPECIES: ABC transporter substrate-binding protein [Brenneria]|uniref:ABC transporter substrate-binding protein n=1 Tax=Brenneria nigrifluens DSM 30175 = ATCC 13028 TaxID=1121120 RepID=A0A2U1UPI3_9GAMM|nr:MULTISPECIES: ABC transporter substrate-binding protein [Brenneria]EHD21456.1 ABC-type transporter, periplasmic subunit [Brenneria sp. EniD312]PWC23598.1 ABC transporter substrate-binding protein [Brenneria nigrifluens DSM 30175 = ATCC 13028]QCR04581.1 ABC transporter substrate-binding protein [Brenneria nigrifluens DSM 30175 = ATCC 13028]
MRIPARKLASLALLFSLMSPLASASELVIAQSASATALDPGFLKEPATLVDNLFDTLVMRDPQMNLQPGLALSWQAIDDSTWQFELRQGVKFSNGEPVNAQAVKFSIERILDPANHAPTISYIRTIKSVEVIGDYRVQIRTAGPDPLLPTRMSRYPAYIVPPAYVAQVGSAQFARKPIGSGAYTLAEFVPDEKVVMKANPDYWRGKPAIDSVVWRPIPEATARVTALLTGEVQLVESVPADLVPALRNKPNIHLEQVKGGGLTIYLGLKNDQPPLNDARVRQALSLALNRTAYTSQLLHGFGTPTGTMAGAKDFGYQAIPAPAQDVAKAKALLADAGYPDGFTLRFQAPRRYIASADVAQAIVQDLAAIGVKAQLEVPEWSVYTQQVAAQKQAPLYMLAWGSTQTLDADAALYPILHTGEPYSTVSLPELDKLLNESRLTVDAAKREKILQQIQLVVAQQQPLIPLYREDSIYASSSALTFTGRPDARIPLFDLRLK